MDSSTNVNGSTGDDSFYRPSDKQLMMLGCAVTCLAVYGGVRWYRHRKLTGHIQPAVPTSPAVSGVAGTALPSTVGVGGGASLPPAESVVPPAPVQVDPALRKFMDQVDQQIASEIPSNKLYMFDSPEGPVRLRIIVRYEGRMQLGFFNTPAGVALCHDCPPGTAEMYMDAVSKLAEPYGLQVRMKMGGNINGQQAVDYFAQF